MYCRAEGKTGGEAGQGRGWGLGDTGTLGQVQWPLASTAGGLGGLGAISKRSGGGVHSRG